MPLQTILTKYLRLRYPETLALLHRIEFYVRGGYSIFGICLGAQLLAKAFGAKIVRHRTSLDLTKFAIGEQDWFVTCIKHRQLRRRAATPVVTTSWLARQAI